MGTSYPGGQDSFQRANPNDPLNGPSHAGQHDNAYDAIEAIETELGTNPSGSDATVVARLAAIEAGTNLAAGSVTAAKLGSDVRIGNLLTANQASCTDTLGNTTGFTASNATLSRSTAWSAQGSGSLLVTATGTGVAVDLSPPGTGGLPITPGETVTATATVKGGTSTDALALRIIFWDSGGGVVSYPQTYVTLSGTPQTPTVTATVPAGAAFVSLAATGDSMTSGDTYYIDKAGLWRGAGGTWAMPGQPILGLTDAPIGNLLTLNQASGGDASGDTTGFGNAYQCTLARTTARSVEGSGALRATLTSSSGGCAFYTPLGTSGVPVVAGQTYTALASSYATGTATTRLGVRFYTSGGVSLGDNGGTMQTATGAWVGHSLTLVAPATAAYATLTLSSPAGTSGDTVDWDALSFHRGAAGKFALPGTPVVGQSHIATNGAVHLSGTGSPEGVVTAAPGSTWLQTDATTDVKGWIRWVKATGTGNTGWQAGPEADTGWRALTSFLNGWAGTLYVRRTRDRISWRTSYAGLVNTSATGTTFFNPNSLGSGFMPLKSDLLFGEEAVVWYRSITATALGYWYRTQWEAPSTAYRWGLSNYTQEANPATWPSSLPGSAA